jgi:ADP-ribosylglycohydrolase
VIHKGEVAAIVNQRIPRASVLDACNDVFATASIGRIATGAHIAWAAAVADSTAQPDREELTSRTIGCLLGGAIGDALGAGIEFDSWETISRCHGPRGVTEFVEAYGRRGAITDDTQMTMFTTEGLIRASVRQREKGICHAPSVVRHAYFRWLWTQGDRAPLGRAFDASEPDGWLAGITGLRSRRAPGNTCLSSLARGGVGTIDAPLNDSKGCGAVMRAAPVGLIPMPLADRFKLSCDVAALTHGHPSGYLPAGYLAAVIGAIVDGARLEDAFQTADQILRTWDEHEETAAAVAAGRTLGGSGSPTPEQLAALGGGWTGDEALAIAVACVESDPTFETGVLAAVNHSGDSDSTGSIAGNILGAVRGVGPLPARWLAALELRAEIEQLARDLVFEFHERADPVTADWWKRYPGW